jgi:hypothetical protein
MRKREDALPGRSAGREEQNDGGAGATVDTGKTRVKDEDPGGARAHINLLNRTSASRRISFVRALHLPR